MTGCAQAPPRAERPTRVRASRRLDAALVWTVVRSAGTYGAGEPRLGRGNPPGCPYNSLTWFSMRLGVQAGPTRPKRRQAAALQSWRIRFAAFPYSRSVTALHGT